MHEVPYYRYRPSIVLKKATHLYRCALLFILSILGESWRKGNVEIEVMDEYIWVNLWDVALFKAKTSVKQTPRN